MPFADNNGVRIHYQVEGEGPPLVLQHWSMSTLDSWYDYGYVSGLKDEYQLILLDARGHGASDKPRSAEAYELERRVEDIVAVLDDLGIDQAHYFGYSMGGWIGFGVARHAPKRFRSLIIGGQHAYAQEMNELRDFIQYGIENGPEAEIAKWEETSGPLPSETRRQLLAADYQVLLLVAQDRRSLEDYLPAMRTPCLLFVGEADPVYPKARECSKRMANVDFVVLPGLDHGEVIERCDVVVPLIKRFLTKMTHE